ncbi:hypothetical protein [Mesonia aestuariivivens]|uniref:Beta-hexosaminidase bacterial type N-terminal domain-containing protein n=1 Tax=Mesonia aestuariivivens TaxID=2796128 RepID=A0ABS6W2L7_9FLAO|nr:hypothetical protein [Mesonia aestuariivivens]MBW2962095.1 hypothetical protein [Mesonia aestuariivivens]
MKKRTTTSLSYILSLNLIFVFLSSWAKPQQNITISADTSSPQIQFAVTHIQNALTKKGMSSQITQSKSARIIFSIDANENGIEKEGFILRNILKNQIKITALDEAGAMYGGLELAEQIAIYGLNGVKETTQHPYMAMRGPKFNIPLDARSPSYSRHE